MHPLVTVAGRNQISKKPQRVRLLRKSAKFGCGIARGLVTQGADQLRVQTGSWAQTSSGRVVLRDGDAGGLVVGAPILETDFPSEVGRQFDDGNLADGWDV